MYEIHTGLRNTFRSLRPINADSTDSDALFEMWTGRNRNWSSTPGKLLFQWLLHAICTCIGTHQRPSWITAVHLVYKVLLVMQTHV